MTDTDTQQYLDRAQRSREEQYDELFAGLDRAHIVDLVSGTDADQIDDADQAIDESILGIEKTRGYEVTISTGGPGEWLDCTVDTDGDLLLVQFCVAWWSPVQRTTVNEGDALWRLADRMNPYQYE